MKLTSFSVGMALGAMSLGAAGLSAQEAAAPAAGKEDLWVPPHPGQRIYADALVEQLFMLDHDLVFAALHAVKPGTTGSVVIASNVSAKVGTPSSPKELTIVKNDITVQDPKSMEGSVEVREVRFPLVDGNDNVLGLVVTRFKSSPNKEEWEYYKEAMKLRDYLRRRVRNVSYLYHPETIYQSAVWTGPARTFAQQWVDGILSKRQDIVHVGIHAKVPGLPRSVIVASSFPNRIGRPSGPGDVSVWRDQIYIIEVPEGENQFEVCVPVLDSKDNVLGTLLVEYKYYEETRPSWEYVKEVLGIRDDLKKQIQGIGDLIKPAENS